MVIPTTPSLNAASLKRWHDAGLSYADYLATDPSKAAAWRAIDEQISLSPEQERLVSSFSRVIRVLAVSGIWCGDCVQQGPLIQTIANASSQIDLRWVDRDALPELSQQIRINAGSRVPVVVFMAEDFEPVSIMGDRTLTRYRALAAKHLGPSCPLPGAPVPQDELVSTLQDWLDEFERVHLLLRLSGRLRERYGD